MYVNLISEMELVEILSKYLPRQVDRELMATRFCNDLWDAGYVMIDRDWAEQNGGLELMLDDGYCETEAD